MSPHSASSPDAMTDSGVQEIRSAADHIPTAHDGDNTNVPKPKRLACMICRKRKLKCDGVKPSCSTCTRLGHSCAYDEVRRKSGPKRGYVKALEERLSAFAPIAIPWMRQCAPCGRAVKCLRLTRGPDI